MHYRLRAMQIAQMICDSPKDILDYQNKIIDAAEGAAQENKDCAKFLFSCKRTGNVFRRGDTIVAIIRENKVITVMLIERKKFNARSLNVKRIVW